MLKFPVIFLLFFFVGSICYSGTIDPDTPDSKYVEYGSEFVYIAKIHGQSSDTKPFFGSGVAHKPRIILTAAHVVKDVKICKASINQKSMNINKIIIHPKYKEDKFGYYDIAICVLNEDIGLDWYPDLYTKQNEIGKVCCISGYGMTGNFLKGAYKFDDKLRAGSNIIDSVDRGLLKCSPSKINTTELEYCIASGDSGGGLFIDNKIAGINSCIMHDKGIMKSGYGTESGHTRISDHIEWIKRTLEDMKE